MLNQAFFIIFYLYNQIEGGAEMKDIPMEKLPYKILLDRYSEKDLQKNVKVGTIVVATTDNSNPKYPQKEVCELLDATNKDALVMCDIFDRESIYTLPISDIQVPIELYPHQIWKRVARGNAQNETNFSHWAQVFYSMLEDFRFVPGGRILAMCGSSYQDTLTAFNCFVIPSPHDSRGGAIETLNNMVEIMSRGGGVGMNISTLRPKQAIVHGVNGTSSGSVSWGAGYSFYTGLVEQGGSRRGALLEGLAVWHPDIEEFIDIKKTPGVMENANLSVLVTDDFMEAVEQDLEWNLEFPDTKFHEYDTEWDGNLKKWKQKGYPFKIYKTIQAKELWHKIVESAWASGEPGIIWLERYNKLSNTWYFEEIIATNPCGEQGLGAWGVCNLGHINLAKVPIIRGTVDELYLRDIIFDAVRFLDNMIDITPYFIEENRKVQQQQRRIGLGTMGLAELLIKLKIRYGSPQCLDFIDRLYGMIRDYAYEASILLAKEKGAFELFDCEYYLQGEFIQQLPPHLIDGIIKYGIRNSVILTQAPTGSTGTMCGTSTGIEPFFKWVYKRMGRLGTEIQYVQCYLDYLKEIGINHNDVSELPYYFVTANEVTPEEHVAVMGRIQKYVDSSISKTVNVPGNATVEDFMTIYSLAYKYGCKGMTAYRDKSRETQVLESVDEPIKLKVNQDTNKTIQEPVSGLNPVTVNRLMCVPDGTKYEKVKLDIGCGEIQLFIGQYNFRVIDVYSVVNSKGGCNMGIQGMCISISKFLRTGHGIDHFVKSAKEAGTCGSFQYKRGQGKHLKGKSCFDVIVQTIHETQEKLDAQKKLVTSSMEFYQEQAEPMISDPFEAKDTDVLVAVKRCPVCGDTLPYMLGCTTCPVCGYKSCSE